MGPLSSTMVHSIMIKGGYVFFASLGLISIAACSSKNSIVADAGTTTGNCSSPPPVEDTDLKACQGCTPTASCEPSTPLEGCCTWVAEPNKPLARASTLHRYSGSGGVDVSCLSSPGMLGTSKNVTLTGYVWLFSSGQDSKGIKVEVFKETNPNTDGAIDPTPIGSYTTSATDAAYPGDTLWNSKCNAPGCSFRQYTIPNVPTETPLVIKTSDAAGAGAWATLYDYNIYFANSKLGVGSDGGAPVANYDATAAAADDLNTVAVTVGQTIQSTAGLLAGEIHDCGDVRVSGATVGLTVQPAQGGIFYFTSDEGNPLPDQTAHSTSILGLFGGVNFPTGQPIRVTAMGEDPTDSTKFMMLGSYVVQAYPGAVTAISLRGRRPWQP